MGSCSVAGDGFVYHCMQEALEHRRVCHLLPYLHLGRQQQMVQEIGNKAARAGANEQEGGMLTV